MTDILVACCFRKYCVIGAGGNERSIAIRANPDLLNCGILRHIAEFHFQSTPKRRIYGYSRLFFRFFGDSWSRLGLWLVEVQLWFGPGVIDWKATPEPSSGMMIIGAKPEHFSQKWPLELNLSDAFNSFVWNLTVNSNCNWQPNNSCELSTDWAEKTIGSLTIEAGRRDDTSPSTPTTLNNSSVVLEIVRMIDRYWSSPRPQFIGKTVPPRRW